MYIFWNRGVGDCANLIANVTRPGAWPSSKTPAHVGLLDRNGEGWHAHAKDGGWVRTSLIDLLTWQNNHDGRQSWYVDLGEKHSEKWRDACDRQVGLWDYHVWQLGRLWMWRRLKIPPKRDSSRVVCSEAVSRILFDDVDLPAMIGLPVYRHDRVTPANSMFAFGDQVRPGLPQISTSARPGS